MTPRLVFLGALSALALTALSPAAAQTGRTKDVAGFYAIIYSPPGALPQTVLARSAPRDSIRNGWLSLKYGRYKYRDDTLTFSNYGVSGQVRVWRRVYLGASYGYRTCNSGCSGLNMVSVDGSATLIHKSPQEPNEADAEMGLQWSAGYGKARGTDVSAMSAVVWLPLIVALPQPNEGSLLITLNPGGGYGRLHENSGNLFKDASGNPITGDFGSFRLIIGAGVGYLFPGGLGAHVTVHRIAVEESSTQVGLQASWRF